MFTGAIWWLFFFFFSSRRRHTRSLRDWSSDVCSSDLAAFHELAPLHDLARAGQNQRPGEVGGRVGEDLGSVGDLRSEERRVGKEWRSRWSPEHEKKKTKKREVSEMGTSDWSGTATRSR